MARTKAQRSAAAKKAAATRKRNATKRSVRAKKGPPPSPVDRVTDAAKAAGNTVENAAKSVFKRVDAVRSGGGKAKPKRGARKRG